MPIRFPYRHFRIRPHCCISALPIRILIKALIELAILSVYCHCAMIFCRLLSGFASSSFSPHKHMGFTSQVSVYTILIKLSLLRGGSGGGLPPGDLRSSSSSSSCLPRTIIEHTIHNSVSLLALLQAQDFPAQHAQNLNPTTTSTIANTAAN